MGFAGLAASQGQVKGSKRLASAAEFVLLKAQLFLIVSHSSSVKLETGVSQREAGNSGCHPSGGRMYGRTQVACFRNTSPFMGRN